MTDCTVVICRHYWAQVHLNLFIYLYEIRSHRRGKSTPELCVHSCFDEGKTHLDIVQHLWLPCYVTGLNPPFLLRTFSPSQSAFWWRSVSGRVTLGGIQYIFILTLPGAPSSYIYADGSIICSLSVTSLALRRTDCDEIKFQTNSINSFITADWDLHVSDKMPSPFAMRRNSRSASRTRVLTA